MEDDNKSLEFFIKASVIQESVLGINHPNTISTYFNIGVVYESIGNENKANEYYRKAGKH
jgi:Tfp pilus assembly protein PilF